MHLFTHWLIFTEHLTLFQALFLDAGDIAIKKKEEKKVSALMVFYSSGELQANK